MSSSRGTSLCLRVKMYSQLVLIKMFVIASRQYLWALNLSPLNCSWKSFCVPPAMSSFCFTVLFFDYVCIAKSPSPLDSSPFSLFKRLSLARWSRDLRLDCSTFSMKRMFGSSFLHVEKCSDSVILRTDVASRYLIGALVLCITLFKQS